MALPTVTKTYASRGPIQQFRPSESTSFSCFRCGDNKNSKLVTVYYGNWSRLDSIGRLEC
jgi:hypothetical protein